MANLKVIKKRISSVKSTQQITRAMKMVAAARFRKANAAVVAARPYSNKLHEVLSSLALREERKQHPLLARRGKKKALLLVMSSDRGLCGGFNINVAKASEGFINDPTSGFEAYDLIVIGRKGKEHFARRPVYNVTKTHEGVTSQASYGVASLLGQEVVAGYSDGSYDGVFVIYNAFRSAICQELTVDQLLPIVPREVTDETVVTDYIYEPDRGEVLNSILPKYVEVQIYRAFVESLASEHGARMSAMESATQNASDMINSLTLQYNRARQAVITKELTEIISGAESI
ncbi:MAG: ATP synthase F1 subunit gamma [Desulfuromonadales bacterium C00003096]|jgi:F-type H+-transporting ATPase subunit gamma|nr:MAG: ATP synthase F1 subunit gamma [Desulfuromonadales bacterium C00003096]